MKRRKKIILWLGGIAIFGIVLLVVGCNLIVAWDSNGKTYDSVSQIPHNRVGLLLATSPITPGGAHNFYFDNRIKAAYELYKAGKIDYIIASGGDYTKTQKIGCDEPKSILDSLVARGVPADRIILDYEGTTTRNSIYKAGQIYDLDSVTIISQKDHNERAIFLASLCQIKAVGYNAAPSHIRRNRIKNTLREYLARVKMFGTIIIATTPAYQEDEAGYSKIHQENP
ncbi:ElyC/SanA/YdcF family protein [Muribaculum sp.]|uniref:SanA/YdcF family protein n=1 Tax=Muribaculum sp. TaxID=1918611 RepID=UPI002588E9B8|nr:ElyC/SanA/YdcF family protein [Muribaculum sp.]MCX4278087.1 YdcF family protein [Muribaculum sp.]